MQEFHLFFSVSEEHSAMAAFMFPLIQPIPVAKHGNDVINFPDSVIQVLIII